MCMRLCNIMCAFLFALVFAELFTAFSKFTVVVSVFGHLKMSSRQEVGLVYSYTVHNFITMFF